MNNEEMLRVIRRHILEAILQVMRDAKGQLPQKAETNDKRALHLKKFLSTPPINARRYHENFWIASPVNQVGVTKPN